MAEQIKHALALVKEARIAKKRCGYFEIDAFKDSDLNHGYFCYSCVYFINIQGGRCAIVHNHGEDCLGKKSDVIAPYAYCSLWAPNKEIIKRK